MMKINIKAANITLSTVFVLLLSSSLALGKFCWEPCSSSSINVTSVNIVGCLRHPNPDGIRVPRSRCQGSRRSPCFVPRKNWVMLQVEFVTDPTLGELTQDAVWVTPVGLELPWLGVDHDACTYSNRPCGQTISDHTNERKTVSIQYPIWILQAYPSGTFNIKWRWYNTVNGEKKEAGCSRFAIEIV